MKNIIFDTSTIISLATNNLLWTLIPLKKRFNGDFFITESVKKEIVDKPLKTKRFKFEAIILKDYVEEDILTVYNDKSIKDLSSNNLNIINNIFYANKQPIKIVHQAEVECMTLFNLINSSALVMDEKISRLLIESPLKLSNLLSSRLHKKIEINQKNLRELKKDLSNIKVIRSCELMTIAYDLKILDKFITDKVLHHELRKDMLDGLLWGLKLKGCAINPQEINQILKMHGY